MTKRRGGFRPRAARLLPDDYRLAVFTAIAALVRGQLAGQADGSETGQARPLVACLTVAALTFAALAFAPLIGHEPPQVAGSHAAGVAATFTA
jgi:hypothetical protein